MSNMRWGKIPPKNKKDKWGRSFTKKNYKECEEQDDDETKTKRQD